MKPKINTSQKRCRVRYVLLVMLMMGASIAVISGAHAQSAPVADLSANVEGFVKSSLTGTTTISRWRDGICPATNGFSEQGDNDRVTDRIRQIASLVGVPVAVTPCATNIHIYFTSDPQTLLNSIHDHGGASLFTATPSRTAHPIQVGYATVERDGHSGALVSNVTVAEYGSARAISELAQVYVVADVNQTKAYSFTAVANYIAMLSLADMKIAEGCQKLPSITNLIFSDCDDNLRPNESTAADLEHLAVTRVHSRRP